jgi:glycosyltransferase involved in cell wall biosynthesis
VTHVVGVRSEAGASRILIGIPTRNRPDLVRDAVLSVQRQTVRDFRLIVTENPSDPAVSAENRAWIESLEDPRIEYVLQPIDGGEYGQARYLFSRCHEPFMCMLHDDDMMEPDYVERALEVLESREDVALYASSQYLIDRQGVHQPALTQEYSKYQARDRFAEGRMESFLEPLMEFGLFSISGAVFRSSCLDVCGIGDPDMGGIYPFEFNMFLRLAERGFAAWYSPQKRIAYRWHAASMRQSDGSILTRYMVENLIALLERRRFAGRAEHLRRRLLAFNKRNLGYILLVAGERRAAMRQLHEAIRLYPRGMSIWWYAIRALVAPHQIVRTWRARVNLNPPSASWAEAVPASPVVRLSAADRVSVT